MNAREWIAIGCLAGASTAVFAQDRSFVAVRDDGVQILGIDLPGGTARGMPTTATLSAAVLADAGAQTLRAAFVQNALPGGGNSARVDSFFARRISVPATAAAPNPGDPTTLSFQLQAHGTMSVDVEGLVWSDLSDTLDDPTSTPTTCDNGVCVQLRQVARFAFSSRGDRDLTGVDVTPSSSARHSLRANGIWLLNEDASANGPGGLSMTAR